MDMISTAYRASGWTQSSSAAARPGLSAGYHLAKRGRAFVILDAGARVGDNWRCHWDSLRLYIPAFGLRCPACGSPARRAAYPTKDQMADFLESYAQEFDLPVRGGVRVTRLVQADGRYLDVDVVRGDRGRQRHRGHRHVRPDAEDPRVCRDLDPAILPASLEQLQESRPAPPGGVLVVGRVALRRRHRVRGRRRPSDRPVRADPRRGAVRHQRLGTAHRLSGAVLPRQARADDQVADRRKMRARDRNPRWTTDPGQARRPRERVGVELASGPDGRGPRRPTRTRRRTGARRRKRGLVHRFSTGVRVDRAPGASTRTAGRSSNAAWWQRARALLHRARVPVRVQLDAGRRRRSRRRVRRPAPALAQAGVFSAADCAFGGLTRCHAQRRDWPGAGTADAVDRDERPAA